jgi:hypothetical protein
MKDKLIFTLICCGGLALCILGAVIQDESKKACIRNGGQVVQSLNQQHMLVSVCISKPATKK